jgi:hypothetical protein
MEAYPESKLLIGIEIKSSIENLGIGFHQGSAKSGSSTQLDLWSLKPIRWFGFTPLKRRLRKLHRAIWKLPKNE